MHGLGERPQEMASRKPLENQDRFDDLRRGRSD